MSSTTSSTPPEEKTNSIGVIIVVISVIVFLAIFWIFYILSLGTSYSDMSSKFLSESSQIFNLTATPYQI